MKPNYEHKIKTRESLAEALGRRPRGKSVIMCHGVFDIVHPGHLRHLLYAKEKADLLVASLTVDKGKTSRENDVRISSAIRTIAAACRPA